MLTRGGSLESSFRRLSRRLFPGPQLTREEVELQTYPVGLNDPSPAGVSLQTPPPPPQSQTFEHKTEWFGIKEGWKKKSLYPVAPQVLLLPLIAGVVVTFIFFFFYMRCWDDLKKNCKVGND